MRRATLRLFLRRFVLVSALPAGGCIPLFGGDCGPPPQTTTILFDGGAPLDGPLTDAGCAQLCAERVPPSSGELRGCRVTALDGGNDELACVTKVHCIGGRRPIGLVAASAIRGDELGAYFARLAHLEAASIEAFRRLAHDLARHEAPAALVAGARRAADDEVRHARLTAGLARRHGAAVPPVEIAAASPLSLLELARDNATEGQIAETYGAIVATWQSQHAPRPIARAMARLAHDETRHSELASAIGAWLDGQLTAAERKEVAAARHAARLALVESVEVEVAPTLVTQAGLPDRSAARRLVAAATLHLWS